MPNNTGVAVVPGSFSIPPTRIVHGTNFDTLQWTQSLAFGESQPTFTWQSALTNLQPGEARAVTGASTVQFTDQGTPGTIPLPPAVVSSAQVLGLTPAAQTVAPAAAAAFDVNLQNPTDSPVTYTLSVQGVSSSWVNLAPTVMVAANGSADVPLTLTADEFASLASYGFTVVAAADTGYTGIVQGTLTLAGPPAVQPDPEAHGVVVSLTPAEASAGQGTAARYVLQLTNTGSADDTFALAAAGLPAGVTAAFSQTTVEVPPGASNFRDVTLILTPQVGTAAGSDPFTVTATSTTRAATTGTAAGTLDVLANGVSVSLNPPSAAPGSTLQMTVTNTGQVTDTFDLALGGPAALVATLSTNKVTLAPGASQVVPIATAAVNFAVQGALDLIGSATSESNPAVKNSAAAALAIPPTTGLTAAFAPAVRVLPVPGTTSFLLQVNNTGNTEQAYSATITGKSGSVSASLMGLDGQPAQSIPIFRLPGLSSGAILLNTSLAASNLSTVTVQVASLNNPEVTTATAMLSVATSPTIPAPPTPTPPTPPSQPTGSSPGATVPVAPSPGISPPPFVSVALTPYGEVVQVVDAQGNLRQYDVFGVQFLGSGFRSSSFALSPFGEILVTVTQAGVLQQFDAFGLRTLGTGVLDASVAFGPFGEVLEVVTADNVLRQYDVFGVHTLGSGIVSVGVAISSAAGEVMEVAYTNGELIQSDLNGVHPLLGGVLSASAASNLTPPPAGIPATPINEIPAFVTSVEVLDVIFSNGNLTQFNAFGQRVLGKLF